MIGAGIFVALAPAAAAAGTGLLVGLAVAAVIAYCNATSSARLAARYPQSGGTYVYGRERLGEFWGYLAGWSFVVGKTASCAAMALTVGYYVWPGHAHAVAVAAVVALTALNYTGIEKSALLTRVIVAVVLAVLTAVVVVIFGFGDADASRLVFGDDVTVGGVLQAAGLLFFAFAGYARIATLGEEVRDPARTIPRAIPIALGITLVALRGRGGGGAERVGRCRAGVGDRTVGRSRWRRRVFRLRTGGPRWGGGGGARLAAGAHPRCLAHHAGDGPRSAPAPCAGRGASKVRQPAPRRGGGGRRRRRRRRGGRRARRDRLLVVRGAAVLRDHQCFGTDPWAPRSFPPPAWPAACCWRSCCRSPRCWSVRASWPSARWPTGRLATSGKPRRRSAMSERCGSHRSCRPGPRPQAHRANPV